jgi:ribosomal-protein-alanine N-acetyltransferase
MSQEQDANKKTSAESFADMFKAFGQAVSKILDDPELKEKVKEFTESAAESAKTFGSRFKDDDVKAKFRDVGKAAEDFGKSIKESFKKEK